MARSLQHLSDREVIDEAQRLCSLLDPRAGEVLRLWLGLDQGVPRTLENVAEILEMSLNRARKVAQSAMHQLDAKEPGHGNAVIAEIVIRLVQALPPRGPSAYGVES